MKNFADRLRGLRAERRMRQQDMADQLQMTLRGYQCYELAKNYPDVTKLIALADFFGVTLDYLVGRSDSRS
ncbi:MAG: helix-turn-helix transcriptional regulator [Oscillibacter sp.]